MKQTKSIVLLSGGLDSAVALFWSKSLGHNITTITFDYFRRSRRETQACEKITDYVKCPNERIGLEFLREVDDLKLKLLNPALSRAESAYIPCRNVIFYGIAASFAEVYDSRYIVGGHNKNDVANFPDASRRFFNAFNSTASIGRFTGARTGKVILPLANLNKNQVIKLGARLGVPFELTWSCYRSGKRPCGTCLSCRLRSTAFREAGIKDPSIS